MWRAIAKCMSDLRKEILLILDSVGYKETHPEKKTKIGVKRMSKRSFEEILEELVKHIMASEDEEAIVLVDELEESAKKFIAEKERLKGKLDEILKKAEELLPKDDSEEKREERRKDGKL